MMIFIKEYSNNTYVISSYRYVCQASLSQIKSITQPLAVLASWEGSLGTCVYVCMYLY
jgi:hypothetical protein